MDFSACSLLLQNSFYNFDANMEVLEKISEETALCGLLPSRNEIGFIVIRIR
jgi:hypothetical protein